jgi:RNA polymerase sigma factor (sigma-70 family)
MSPSTAIAVRLECYTRAVPHRGERRLFATTHWSLVLAAGEQRPSGDAHQALTTLCETYWYPLYGFLRGRGHSPADAEDLTQAFFTLLLEKQVLRLADPARGRFRSFLLKSLQNFATNVHDRNTARKRGGGVPALSLEFDQAEGRFRLEPSNDETPERTFDRRWALTLLDRVIARVRADAEQKNKQDQFEALKPYLTGDEPQLSYAETARTLGISEGAVKVAVHRLRRKFRDTVRDEISQTVSSPAEIEDELRHLWSAVART